MLQPLDREGARLLVLRQEAHGNGVVAGLGQVDAGLARPVAQQGVGGLDHAAGTVADQRVGADRAAMVEIDQDLQALSDNVVRLLALYVDDEADAAGVMLVAGVVKSLFQRQIGQIQWLPAAGQLPPNEATVWAFLTCRPRGGKSDCWAPAGPVTCQNESCFGGV